MKITAERLVACVLFVSLGSIAVACGGKPPPKEPLVQETVSDAGPPEPPPEPPKPKSLFERLGGKEGIAKIVDSFVKNVTNNDATKKRFAKLQKEKIEKLRTNLTDQICKESGGECEAEKAKDATKGLKITDAEWNAALSALKAALEENKVAENEQNDLIASLAPMKDDVVEVKAKPGKK